MASDNIDYLLRKKKLLERQIALQEGLPFLYGWKWYKWARLFFESRNKMNLMVAANQISKSSTQIRKCIHWATCAELWPQLWERRPLQFWYLYPSKETATIEFEKKWIPEFLPKGEFKDHPVYGWKYEYRSRNIFALHFNTGVSVYFKTYAQDAQHLQTGTCYAIFCDEELPVEIFDELMFRLAATDGYFHMVFTATLGQEMWKDAMEGRSTQEKFPEAFKQNISMYDCLVYEDGTESHWSEEKIQRIKNKCKSQQEILRRVYGRFVLDSGLKYPGFNKSANFVKPYAIPPEWAVYTAVDIGSGGSEGHPAAICFLAVRPDYQKGALFKMWRGDQQVTTDGDILDKHTEMKRGLLSKPVMQVYDWSSKDFSTIANRSGETFTPADKSHDRGESILNVLFKNQMLDIFDTLDVDGEGMEQREGQKLVSELIGLQKAMPKNKAKDDLCDAARYVVSSVPWDWEAISSNKLTKPTLEAKTSLQIQLEERRKAFDEPEQLDLGVNEEINEWNELYGS